MRRRLGEPHHHVAGQHHRLLKRLPPRLPHLPRHHLGRAHLVQLRGDDGRGILHRAHRLLVHLDELRLDCGGRVHLLLRAPLDRPLADGGGGAQPALVSLVALLRAADGDVIETVRVRERVERLLLLLAEAAPPLVEREEPLRMRSEVAELHLVRTNLGNRQRQPARQVELHLRRRRGQHRRAPFWRHRRARR